MEEKDNFSTENNHTNIFLYIIISIQFIFLVLLGLGFIYVLYDSTNKQNEIENLKSQITENIMIVEESPSTPEKSNLDKDIRNIIDNEISNSSLKKDESNFKKFPYRSREEMFLSKGYPSKITSYTESEVIGLDCKISYKVLADEGYSYRTEVELESGRHDTIPVTDESLKKFLKFMNQGISTEEWVSQATVCDTELGEKIIIYSYDPWSDSVSKGDVYFGYLDQDGMIDAELRIPYDTVGVNHGGVYFSCYAPLLMVKNGPLYYQCGGGDSGAGMVVIFTVDLEKGIFSNFYECSGHTNETGSNTVVTCNSTTYDTN